MITQATQILSAKTDLSREQMTQVMEEVMSGKASTSQIAAFLKSLNDKGETAEELTAAVLVMRRYALEITTRFEMILDTCGTGGDARGTFNISTVAAFVVSGSGITVAKHGNRSVSSNSGSADVLEVLGIDINMDKNKIQKCLEDLGIAFLFAPNFHPATKFAMPARKELGKRTIFNLIGPLSNPAGATHQLIGVYDKKIVEVVAGALASLGTKHALIVHGADGLDEITTTAETFVCEEISGQVKSYQIKPEDFGFKKVTLDDLSGGSIDDNAEILLDVLGGKKGPQRDIVVFNAAAGIYAADKAGSIEEGIEYAELSIDSGAAMDKFKLLREYSHK